MNIKFSFASVALLASCLIGGQLFAQGSATKQGSMTKQGSATKQGSMTKQGSAMKKTIAESIDPNSFSTLYHAVGAAGLGDALKGEGPFTVFAPNDIAFSKIPMSTVQSLFQPANKDKLTNILKYHVVAGKVMAADVVELSEATTLAGQKLKIETKDGKVFLNGIQVIKTDIECSNGVIHLIDGVLIPSKAPMKKAMPSEGSGSKATPVPTFVPAVN